MDRLVADLDVTLLSAFVKDGNIRKRHDGQAMLDV